MPNPPARISPLLRAVVRRALHPDFFFVNIGANDGVSNDPIYPFLRDHGWRGIAVEPLEPIFAELRRNYSRFPGVILERAAIAPEPRPFYYIPATAGYERTWTKQVGTLDPAFLTKTIRLMRAYELDGPVPAGLEDAVVRIDVPCLTFDALMAKHRAERVDFINIDAEGLDYELACAIDLTRWRPAVLCLETVDMRETQRTELEARFAAHGYVFLEPFDLFSSVYVRRALAPGRASRLLRRARARLRTALGGRSGLTGRQQPT
jgi:FkbM family methyltransferase